MRDNILDRRFEGKAIKLRLIGIEEPLEGVVDEVSKYEIGIRTPRGPVVVFRHSIAHIEVSQTDLHGFSSEELEDVIITSEMTGAGVEVVLSDKTRIDGKLSKISRYEIGVRAGDRALVIPKSAISYIIFQEVET
ncbi:MAG: hypothetical protein RMI56_00505 [Sulfolobales archaeon]|nr:hypothetical protein [Sulfolobales archaeon]MDW8082260.1 hypothetical protein [Sulfolobales archaeon]